MIRIGANVGSDKGASVKPHNPNHPTAMFKLITATLLTLVLSISSIQAGTSPKVFAGKYDGITSMENVTGKRIFYSPVRFKIDTKGKITGTAYRDATGKVYTVKGKIVKIKTLFGIRYLGTASGTFSDGTKWKAEVEANKGVSAKIIRGKAVKSTYSGTVSLTNL